MLSFLEVHKVVNLPKWYLVFFQSYQTKYLQIFDLKWHWPSFHSFIS
jgi:hypothetical protein